MLRIYSVTIAACLVCNLVSAQETSSTLDRVFAERYREWKEYISQPQIIVQSTAKPRIENPCFKNIVDLGPRALPYIAAKMEQDPDAYVLGQAIGKIAKVKVRNYDYLQWWKQGRYKTGERFESLCGQWKKLKAGRKDPEAQQTYEEIGDLGIAVLPFLVANSEIEPELVPLISRLTDQELPTSATAVASKRWWAENKQKWELPDTPNYTQRLK